MSDDLALDLSRIGRNGTGPARFAMQILDCLLQQQTNITVVANSELRLDSRVQVIPVPSWLAMTQAVSRVRPLLWLLYAFLFFPRQLRRVITPTHHVIPGAREQVVCVLDLRPYFFPDSLLQRIYFRYLLPRSLSQVKAVLTISEATRKLIIEYYRVPPERIHVVHCAIDVTKFRVPARNERAEVPYLLVIGATWKHKNAHELLLVAHLWRENFKVKIVCGHGSYSMMLRSMVRENGLTESVEFLDYISDSRLLTLYQNAAALVYPSLMEGFGLPPLEAAACGTPVIVSDIPVFREIYGDFPIYVQLGREESWRDAINLLANVEVTASKIQAGFERSNEYSTERMCRELHAAIEEIWPQSR